MRLFRTIALSVAIVSLVSCGKNPRGWSTSGSSTVQDGLAVGFVVNSGQSAALKGHERRRYSDKLASAILEFNPSLTGNLDSYEYVAARVGKPFSDLINSYRLEGDLSSRALNQFHSAQLRRRYLMLATILPVDEVIELRAEVNPKSGPSNFEVEDYEDVRLQTVRLREVQVQVYDLIARRKIRDLKYGSDNQDTMLAAETEGRRYVGNSLFAALANGVSNRIQHGGDLTHPKAPGGDMTLDHLWRQVAQSLPGALKY